MAAYREGRLTYEEAMRSVGRYLDAEPAYDLSILETGDGFTVRYRPSQHHSDERTVHFTWHRLQDLQVFYAAGRGSPRRRGRFTGIWAEYANGHQDFFRALGFNLDRERGTSLAVDEVPEGIAVSYLRPDPTDPIRMQKHHTMYRHTEIREMADEAQQRRSAEPSAAGT